MGKLKHDSDDDMAMDIEQPRQNQTQKKVKKNKLIAKKNKLQPTQRSSSALTISKKNNVIRQLAKSVNLKTKSKSLDHKQAIFQKVIQGLKDKSGVSRKNKKKTRVLMKKELRKHLQEERVHNRKRSTDASDGMVAEKTIHVQIKNPEKAKKKQVNERAQVASFHQLMGAGLHNIKNMIAKNSFKPVGHQ